MCDIMEELLAEEKKAGRINAIQRLIKKGVDKEFILSLEYVEEEISEA